MQGIIDDHHLSLTGFSAPSRKLPHIHQYGELIALDILYKYVLEVIDILHDSAAQLKSVQVDDAHMDRFLNQLRIDRERITERRQNTYQHMDTTLSFIKSTQLIEKQLYVMLGHVANEESWA